MFCKYCGKPLSGSLCSYCGKETTLIKSSSELEKLMTNPKPPVFSSSAVPPVIPSPSSRGSEKTYKQGYDEGYRKGADDGYRKASNDILTDSQNKIAALKAKYRKLILILCGIVFLFSVAISGLIFGNLKYDSGYQAGNAKGVKEGQKNGYNDGYNQATSELTKSFESKVNQAFDDGYKKGKEDLTAETAAAMQKPDSASTDQNTVNQHVTPEPTSSPEILYSRTQNNGSKNNPSQEIIKIQAQLMKTGYLNDDPDGIIGNKTEKAIKSFQKDHGLPETGKIDTETYKLLFSDVYASVSPTATLTPESSDPSVENNAPLDLDYQQKTVSSADIQSD